MLPLLWWWWLDENDADDDPLLWLIVVIVVVGSIIAVAAAAAVVIVLPPLALVLVFEWIVVLRLDRSIVVMNNGSIQIKKLKSNQIESNGSVGCRFGEMGCLSCLLLLYYRLQVLYLFSIIMVGITVQ